MDVNKLVYTAGREHLILIYDLSILYTAFNFISCNGEKSL